MKMVSASYGNLITVSERNKLLYKTRVPLYIIRGLILELIDGWADADSVLIRLWRQLYLGSSSSGIVDGMLKIDNKFQYGCNGLYRESEREEKTRRKHGK